MLWVVKFEKYDGGRSLQWWKEETFQDAYRACVPVDMTKWHVKVRQAVRSELLQSQTQPVLVSYNEALNDEIKTTYYIVENDGSEPMNLDFLNNQ